MQHWCARIAVRLVLFSGFLALCAPNILVAQDSKEQPTSGGSAVATIRKNTRLVLVDVVVTDKKGNPVTGLQRDDFRLLDQGKAQQVSVFEEHAATTAPASTQALQPGEFTNVPLPGVDQGSVDVLLFDTLNAAVKDQMYAKQELIGFLKEAPAGKRIAIFELSTRLRMVQGFTTDRNLLLAAADNLAPHTSAFYFDADQREEEEEMLAWMEAAIQDPARAAEFRRSVMAARSEVADQRVLATLESMEALARALSGYRGRKNLIWLSSGFPMTMRPDLEARNPLENIRTYASRARQAATMMADAQIAIYPVDSHGMYTTVSNLGLTTLPTPGRFPRRDRTPVAIEERSEDEFNVRSSMGELADQTGGRVFYNTSDLKKAMADATSMPYYTLAYRPDHGKWEGKFRRIEVKAAKKGLKLSYRRGYFAVADAWQTPVEEMNRNFVVALQLTSPDSTALALRVQIHRPAERPGTVQIQYSVDASGLNLVDAAENRKSGVVDFVAVAWNQNNRSAGKSLKTATFNIRPEEMDSVLHNGLPFSNELTLKPGTYNLKLGVMDRNSGKIGTVLVPVTVR